ncbi:Dihydrofolate reductase [Devosia sp. YR412]|uniref:dihydrofolate reductase family protein n=1 Tax=Devosia sp. YR412 TaxID=1881030 RepID=UPI0008BC7877|nr:dihydrofolate reductase family protein [Devosia sp. YR412]SEP81448.1 Dihydrofolate reductase [Devosia sp. YR412]
MSTQSTGHVYIAVSIDGFIARLDGSIDWLDPYTGTGEDLGYDCFMESIDGVVMGRNTFEKILTFGKWPFDKPVFVLSRHLSEQDVPVDLKSSVRIVSGSPHEIMAIAAEEGLLRIYVDGGSVIRRFIADGLVEDLVLTRVPILLGRGIGLFGDGSEVSLQHVATSTFQSGLTQSTYRVAAATTR